MKNRVRFLQSFMLPGVQTLDTGGGVQVITDDRFKVGDICLVTLQSDDSGTATAPIRAVVTDNTLTITRNDDASSADDAVVSWLVIRDKPSL